MMRKLLLVFMMLLVIASMLAAAGAVSLYMWAARDLPSFKKIADYRPPLVTTVYANDGSVLGYLYREKRFLARLQDMPAWLPRAFLAAEDKSFYAHEGIDIAAIVRAFLKNLKAGSTVQGGSTITQQIIKRLLLTSEKSYERKLKEAILAYRLENYLSKDEILTIYLNQIYLGSRAYGVEAAARTYFGKHVGELTLAESALLAGLPQAPSRYDPYHDPEAAKSRQHYVLGRMYEEGWISKAEYDTALNQPLVFKSMPDNSWKQGAYYLDEVRRWLVENLSRENMEARGVELERYGEDAAYESGLHVYTAMDLEHQLPAEAALRKGLEASTRRRGWRGPIEHLAPEAWEEFTRQAPVAPEELQPGAWFKVLVTAVKREGAHVRFGENTGFIPVKTMSWCRTPNPQRAPESVPPVTDATKVLQTGDVVWASLEQPEDKAADQPRNQVLRLALQQRPVVQGALVSLEPSTGEVKALVGGYDYADSQFNRATQAFRQPGSAFKPVVFSAALDCGFTPATQVMDAPMTIRVGNKIWRPENYSQKFYGPTPLRTALAKSRNLVTIRLAQRIGIRKVIKRAKGLGLEPEFPPYLPISLGAVSVRPINLCQAYSAFARGGTTVEPRLVNEVKGPWGESIIRNEPKIQEAISPQNAFVMTWMLKEVVNAGTAARARALGRPVAGKTGTSNEERDAWFVGFTPYLLSCVYIGFDQSTPMGKLETGGRAALPVWIDYRKAVEERYPVQDFPQPPGVQFVRQTLVDYAEDGTPREGTYNIPYFTPSSATASLEPGDEGLAPGEEAPGDEPLVLDDPIQSGQGGKPEDLFKQMF